MEDNEYKQGAFSMIENLFKQFGANVDVEQSDVEEMADEASQADLTDEADVRELIRSVGAMIGREIAPEVEEKLVTIITNGDAPTDMASLMAMLSQ